MSIKPVYRVLIVDDDPDILELLQYNLAKEGYEVKTARNGQLALETARDFMPHLVLLDIMMPVMDGVETCRQLREIPTLKQTHVMFLTARAEEFTEVAAFEVGANDFIPKPIKPRALISRISALFRFSSANSDDADRIVLPDLVIDRNSYTVTRNGEALTLPKKEFELLNFLAANPHKVYSRDDLLYHIWGADVYVLPRTVDVHVRKVREKIGSEYIQTIKGVGYKFDPDATPAAITDEAG